MACKMAAEESVHLGSLTNVNTPESIALSVVPLNLPLDRMPLTDFWRKTIASIKSVVEDETDLICNLANISAVLFEDLNAVKDNKVNWVGFYLQRQPDLLILGPFQGKVACTRIPFGRGVCGAAAATKQTQFVPNVHQFEGHIACDSASESEVVVPLYNDSKVFGVLDLDALVLSGFDESDKEGLEVLCREVIEPCFSRAT